MYTIDFSSPVHVHFIGIGGISMSGLAELLYKNGFKISGSDAKRSDVTKHLEALGIDVSYGQRPSNIPKETDCVVFTAAIKPDNEEFVAAGERNLPMLERAELLGQIMLYFKSSIGIAGTHGKTTTTSMLSLILIDAGKDPTVSVGGILKNIGGNIRIGNSDIFVAESCEYTNSFLKFNPKHEIILNIEAEHLDFFKDIDDIRHSFKEFALKIPKDGNLVINSEINNCFEIVKDLQCNVITYGVADEQSGIGIADCNFTAANVTFNSEGFGSYDLYKDGVLLGHIRLNVIGRHNVSNSVSAAALAYTLGVSFDSIACSLSAFSGTNRRFEHKGEIGGVKIIDDYAHHPTEIRATLTAAKACPHNRIFVVFQPHTYSRTKILLKDIASALSEADEIVLTPIYAAREKNPGDISSYDIVRELEKLGKKSVCFEGFDEIENYLLEHCTNGDLLITMGAGDVVTIGEALLGK